MITRQQAMTADRFHEDHEPAGKIYEWRRNGATKTWKTRPDEFRVPVKYGLRSYGYIDETSAYRFHVADECPTHYVRSTDSEGNTFFGIVISEPIADRAGYGVTEVQVTHRETSRHRVGSRQTVPTKSLTYM